MKRIYEPPVDSDGYRVLVDRVWPRGLKKETARLDEWNRTIAPSDELRKWFGHKPERFREFEIKYRQELAAHQTELDRLRKMARRSTLTILYGAKDEVHNQAAVLVKMLNGK